MVAYMSANNRIIDIVTFDVSRDSYAALARRHSIGFVLNADGDPLEFRGSTNDLRRFLIAAAESRGESDHRYFAFDPGSSLTPRQQFSRINGSSPTERSAPSNSERRAKGGRAHGG
jgi:hypothetical protein